MPKTLRSRLKMRFLRARLRRRGIRIHHHSIVVNASFGDGTVVEPYNRISGAPTAHFGRNTYINVGCHMLGEISVGNDVLFGPKVVVWGRDHGTDPGQLIRKQPRRNAPIVIGDDVWIGAGAIILKGVTIGSGAIVGAGSVVIKDVAPRDIVVGNPARVVKRR